MRKTMAGLGMISLLVTAGSWLGLGGGPLPKQTKGRQDGHELLGCCKAAYCPKIFTFFGDQTTLLADLDRFIEPQVRDRRVYAFVLESSDSAVAILVERDGKGRCTAFRWQGKSVDQFHDIVRREFLANKGVMCVGEQFKACFVKMSAASLVKEEEIPEPASARSAILHDLVRQDKKYLSLTVFLLC